MNKREPLLSDEYLGTLAPDPEWPDGPDWYPSSKQVRDYYESLIDSGKLRVVEEVELVRVEPGRQFYHPPWYCGACDYRITYYDEDGQEAPRPAFCPGCGNKIKR